MSALAKSSEQGDEDDIRPLVRVGGASNMGLWLFLVALLVGGYLFYGALESRRIAADVPATQAVGTSERIDGLPPLALPDRFLEPAQLAPQPLPPAPVPPAPPPVVTRVVTIPAPAPPPPAIDPLPQQPRPAIVYDTAALPATPAAALASGERVLATRLANPSLTVPRGTVIPAVLESALDSTRPGQIRAIVSRDVMGFDGSRVLIPRGSRLYGEYASDLQYGQNRALVRWTRLLRPDGVMIELDSPAADPLGRAGIRGKVNGHFWSRFGNAILQSTLDIGVGIATRKAVGDSYVLALPGSTQQVGQAATQNQSQVVPTLTVKQGTSVSVFVAKDLDFSPVEQ